jgi:hypothetical protein
MELDRRSGSRLVHFLTCPEAEDLPAVPPLVIVDEYAEPVVPSQSHPETYLDDMRRERRRWAWGEEDLRNRKDIRGHIICHRHVIQYPVGVESTF